METINLADCYRILELPYGSPLAAVKKSWRVLSQLYHPDRYKEGTDVYERALIKQKALNRARDMLTGWFQQNPGEVPPSPSKQKSVSAHESTSRTSNEEKPKTAQATKSQNSETNDSDSKKNREHSPQEEAVNPSDFEAPQRWENVRDFIIGAMEEGSSEDDINPAKVILLSCFCFIPVLVFSNIAHSFCGEHPPTPVGFIVFVLGVAGAFFMYRLYRVERDVWKAESSKHGRYSEKAPNEVFRDIMVPLKALSYPTSWHIEKRSIDKTRQTYRIHASAEPIVSPTFFQRIDVYLTVKTSWKGSEIQSDFRVNAPGHRFLARRMINDFNRIVEAAVSNP